ncbi:MAG: CHASE2 domain-containing protein, partial [Armatimonadota bacterium]|nr:CHASE2 domain-containing protein [Armatimonadota bacterium]
MPVFPLVGVAVSQGCSTPKAKILLPRWKECARRNARHAPGAGLPAAAMRHAILREGWPGREEVSMRARTARHLLATGVIAGAVTLLLAFLMFGAGVALRLGWDRPARWLQFPSVQLEKWEFDAFDTLLLPARGEVSPPEQVVVVAIDQDTVTQVGEWPFSRSLHARLIRQLKKWGARVIVFDVLFDAPRPGDAAGDRDLVEACRDAGNVILAAEMNAGEYDPRLGVRHVQVIQPFEALAACTQFGLVDCVTEDDGSTRRARVWQEVAGIRVPLLSVLAAARYAGEELEGMLEDDALRLGHAHIPLDSDKRFWINYGGPAGHVPRLPYYQALQGRSGGELVRDRVVFVGATDPAQQDLVLSPYGAEFPGVEVHANITDMLLRNRPLYRLPG